MMNTNNILKDVKEGLMIVDTYEAFDNRLLIMINSVISKLWQIGYDPARDFEVDKDTTWKDLIRDKRFNMIKSFIIENVTLMFDPPTSSYAVQFLKDDIEELEHRIRYEVESGGDERYTG